MRSLILDYLKSVGRAVWPGPALARRIGIGRELNREKVPSLWGVAGKAWFLPYLDTYTGETQTIRSAYRLMWKDPTVKAALLSKIFAVSSLELQVHPDGPGPLAKKVATFVNYAIRQAAGGVSRIVESILLGGLPEGHVLAEKVYRHYDDGEYRGQIGLQGLYDKDPETYRLETDEYRRITRVTPLRQSPATHYNPGAFLLWQHLPIYRNPLGMSDLRAAYRAYWIIDTVWKLRAIGLEKNINPLLKGVYQDVTDKPDLEAMLEQARSQTWLTVPEGVQVEAMELSQRGHSDFRDAILDLRHEVMLGITGAFLQALEGTQTGARSIGEVHESSAELLVWWLAESVAAALQQQIAPDLVAMNFAGAACPEIGLGGVNDASLLASVQVDAGLLDMGLALSKKERYKYYGRQEPEDEGDVLVRPTPPPSGSGGMAGLPFADPTPAKTTPPQPPASPSAAGDFPESAGRSRRAGDDVALAGPDGVQATALLRRSVRSGTAALGELAAAAVERLAAKGKGAMRASRLFTDDERQQFADTAAAIIATAELLGRARIRERARLAKAGTLRFSDATPFAAFADAPIEPLMPLDALEYFRSLVPDLARTPATFGPRMERRAFALAVDADAVLLDKIKQSIAEAIADGLTPGAGGQAVQRILDDAGVSVRNPQYAEMVMRTNVMDAYNQGAMRELQEPDVAEAFPAWKFIGIADGRQRPSHAVHFGKYYPTSATFAEVRDSVAGKFDGFNCRCVLPGQFVNGRVLAASKAFYSGQAVEIVTAQGACLTITANHPVLTRRGYIPADSLCEGDDLVRYGVDDQRLVIGDDVQDVPTLIENVFRAIPDGDALRVAKRWTPFDFHGDGPCLEGDIEIKAVAGLLGSHLYAALGERVDDRFFLRPNVGSAGKAGRRTADSATLANGRFVDSSQLHAGTNESQRYDLAGHTMTRRKSVHRLASLVGGNDVFDRELATPTPRRVVADRESIRAEVPLQSFEFHADAACEFVHRHSVGVFGRELCEAANPLAEKQFAAFGVASRVDHRTQAIRNGVSGDASSASNRGERVAVVVSSRLGGPINRVGFSAAGHTGSLATVADHDAGFLEASGDPVVAHPDRLFNRTDRLPVGVTHDQIQHVRRFHYSGPVYDLMTRDGHFSVGATPVAMCVVHNCNFIPISRAELRELRDQGVALSKFAEVAAFCDCVAGAADRFCMIGPNAHKPGPCPGPEPTAATPDQAPAKAPATRGEMTAAKREGKGKDARVVLADGSPAPAHVKAAMIPPQWTNVQVSLDPKADVIATGRDAAGRSKTVYTDEFHMRNAAHKFARTQAGLKEAANLRRENLANRKDPALRDHADCTWLMQEQATRPGSDADTGAKVKAYGATTLRAEHVVESPDGVRLQFVGKEGVHHDHLIRNPELATMLVERKKSADQRNGRLFDTNYNEVAKYAKSLDSGRFTPKDFRTIRANELAVAEIAKNSVPPKTEKEYKARVKAVAEKVSSVLGNRPAQALESYIDPAVFSVWKVAA